MKTRKTLCLTPAAKPFQRLPVRLGSAHHEHRLAVMPIIGQMGEITLDQPDGDLLELRPIVRRVQIILS